MGKAVCGREQVAGRQGGCSLGWMWWGHRCLGKSLLACKPHSYPPTRPSPKLTVYYPHPAPIPYLDRAQLCEACVTAEVVSLQAQLESVKEAIQKGGGEGAGFYHKVKDEVLARVGEDRKVCFVERSPQFLPGSGLHEVRGCCEVVSVASSLGFSPPLLLTLRPIANAPRIWPLNPAQPNQFLHRSSGSSATVW